MPWALGAAEEAGLCAEALAENFERVQCSSEHK